MAGGGSGGRAGSSGGGGRSSPGESREQKSSVCKHIGGLPGVVSKSLALDEARISRSVEVT